MILTIVSPILYNSNTDTCQSLWQPPTGHRLNGKLYAIIKLYYFTVGNIY
jgi:hypothetical protein